MQNITTLLQQFQHLRWELLLVWRKKIVIQENLILLN